MEVKDVRELPLAVTPGSKTPKQAGESSIQNQSSLSAVPADEVTITSSPGVVGRNAERSSFNEIISTVNVAKQATEALSKVVTSLDGLATQAGNEGTPENRRTILQKEAHELVGEIRKIVHVSAPNGVKPLAGDKIRVEVEEKLGKVLEFLLPDHSRDNLGIESVNFSAKESIIQTKTSIESARRQIEELRDTVRKVYTEVESAVNAAEQSAGDGETVRDVDHAVVLAHDTQKDIETHPKEALESFGKKATLELLD